jgi:hypothetical protein
MLCYTTKERGPSRGVQFWTPRCTVLNANPLILPGRLIIFSQSFTDGTGPMLSQDRALSQPPKNSPGLGELLLRRLLRQRPYVTASLLSLSPLTMAFTASTSMAS